MVISIHDQNEVDRLNKVRTIRSSQHWYNRAQMLAAGPLAKVAQHVRFDVDREDLTVGHAGAIRTLK